MNTPEEMTALYAGLLTAARSGQTLTYSGVAPLAKLRMEDPPDRLALGELLGHISRAEVAQGRPMLSAVVLHKDDPSVGAGFFKLGKELGRVKTNDDELGFLVRELNAVHAAWATVRPAEPTR